MPDPRPSLWTLTARWVFPLSAAPLEGGAVTVAGERIVAVEPRPSRRPDLDLGDCAVVPGLVNAHTHFDLAPLAEANGLHGDFPTWLRAVIRNRVVRSPAQVEADIQRNAA